MQLPQLPDSCLVAILKCCDMRSLFSAARAHPKLHHAAAMALSSISVGAITNQQGLDSVLLYLSKQGQHVDSIDLSTIDIFHGTVSLRQLPSKLQLASLTLACLQLQLQPRDGFQGIVRPGLPLKQLRLKFCTLLDGDEGLQQHCPSCRSYSTPAFTSSTWVFATGATTGSQQMFWQGYSSSHTSNWWELR